jgi:hypothetical protein
MTKFEQLQQAAKWPDWEQVVANGGPPCFHIESGRFCFRAERWGGHDNRHVSHAFVSLVDLLAAIEKDKESL